MVEERKFHLTSNVRARFKGYKGAFERISLPNSWYRVHFCRSIGCSQRRASSVRFRVSIQSGVSFMER